MERPTIGDVVAALAGVTLIVAMSLDWFTVDVTAARIPGAGGLADQAGGSTAWEAFGVTDLILLVAAVLALALLASRYTGGLPLFPVHPGLIVAGAGVVALAATIIGITSPPVEEGTFPGGIVVEVVIEPGAWLAVAACAVIVLGGLLSSRQDPF